ncbi:HNH endonuclease [Corynebacterium incognita]|uniref:HNH endonuclease n=1 Tax=Corynebacterium incognita TaxID=2754725 RepID=A0A7G7CPB7_9CORY|nr:HNH endonuclease signature motif containing protein [Corynebacterium incognita]QNE89433.1 HNH endonuclease [Corynebacterium incognita]
MSLSRHLDTARSALRAVSAALDDASSPFEDLELAAIQMEELLRAKATMDARFVHLAEKTDAPRRAGTTNLCDYLTRTLGISRKEAFARIATARELYGEIPAREVKEADFLHVPVSDRDDAIHKAKTAEEERARNAREHQARARQAAVEVAAEKTTSINQELENLNENASTPRAELFADALEQAKHRTVEDLRIWVRRKVLEANRRTRTVAGKKDHLAAHRKRNVWFTRTDTDGGVRFGGYLPAGMAANLAAALAAGRQPGTNTHDSPQEDKRTLQQRRADQLNAICSSYLNQPGKARRGRGSVVVTGTVDDFQRVGVNTRFATNTGHELNALEVLQNTAHDADYFLACDAVNPVPLALGRAKRSASFEQRLVLAAMELVCSCPDCDVPASECDAHHLQAFIDGGRTDIENLTLLCRRHHTDNNDRHDGAGGLGHYARDALTGKVGWHPPDGEPRFNTTEKRKSAAGVRVTSREPEPPDGRDTERAA